MAFGKYTADALTRSAQQFGDAISTYDQRQRQKQMEDLMMRLKQQQLGLGQGQLAQRLGQLDYYNRNLQFRQGQHQDQLSEADRRRVHETRQTVGKGMLQFGGPGSIAPAYEVMSGGAVDIDPQALSQDRFQYEGGKASASQSARERQKNEGLRSRRIDEFRGRQLTEGYPETQKQLGSEAPPLENQLNQPNVIAPGASASKKTPAERAQDNLTQLYRSVLNRTGKEDFEPTQMDLDIIKSYHDNVLDSPLEMSDDEIMMQLLSKRRPPRRPRP